MLEQLIKAMMLCAAVKLAHELSLLLHLGAKQHHDLKRSALLIVNDLKRPAVLRLVCGVGFGLLLPFITLLVLSPSAPELRVLVLMFVCWLGSLFGELVERSLFFAAVSAPRMPGAFS
jgi:DMSO reductase anchor subunit